MATTLKPKRASLYVRVSTDRQTVENQVQALTAIAEHRGWEIVAVYSDQGVSGAKGRKDRPDFDRMLTDASRGKFDVVMAFALDRIGRSLSDLLATIKHLKECNVGLFIDKANADGDVIDTTTAVGKLLFTIVGAFSEFERDMIVQRVRAGLDRARESGTKSGRPFGRPRIDPKKEGAIQRALAKGDKGLLKIAAQFGVGSGTIQRIKKDMAKAA
jgi:DNA invertase Pin-like site-specific DNA recombinase